MASTPSPPAPASAAKLLALCSLACAGASIVTFPIMLMFTGATAGAIGTVVLIFSLTGSFVGAIGLLAPGHRWASVTGMLVSLVILIGLLFLAAKFMRSLGTV